MITQQQRLQLKEELLTLKRQLENTEIENETQNNIRENTGELSLYDNHPGDMGTELFEREKDYALSNHSQAELEKVNEAIIAMENDSYGKCQSCGKDIPFERLEAVPYAKHCVEHSPDQRLPKSRPVEEDVLIPPVDNAFSERRQNTNQSNKDTFQEVAKFGTSETPSDFEGDYQDYNQLYDEELKDGFTEDYEMFAATDIRGNNIHLVQSETKKEYEEKLDEEGLESPLGEIPYKLTDGIFRKTNYIKSSEKTKKL